jgi:hypothetical protein
MTECEAIKRKETKIHHKTNNSTVSGKTVSHEKSHGVKFRSATLLLSFIVPNTDKTHHIPQISVTL